jgi:16S rRNA (cytidine1402-2'-O)-methyltransferase
MALYLVGTPIGNLEDITLRALRVLRDSPIVIVEKWSDSVKLLKSYDITPPQVINYDENNHHRALPKILATLEHSDAAYITSAGMPGVSDPGARLVEACRAHNILVLPIPGASALTTAIATAGLPGPYLFTSFLPRKESHLLKLLAKVSEQQESLVAYESTHRISKTLHIIATHYPEATLFVGKEMTKQFERYLVGTVSEISEQFKTEPKLSKGEFTLIFRS